MGRRQLSVTQVSTQGVNHVLWRAPTYSLEWMTEYKTECDGHASFSTTRMDENVKERRGRQLNVVLQVFALINAPVTGTKKKGSFPS